MGDETTPAEADQSILNDIKKLLGFDPEYTDFDTDIRLLINTYFGSLSDIGLGPSKGFRITGSEQKWVDFVPEIDDDITLDRIKGYLYIRVRLVFDTPDTPQMINALKEEAAEMLSRLSTRQEVKTWAPPVSL